MGPKVATKFDPMGPIFFGGECKIDMTLYVCTYVHKGISSEEHTYMCVQYLLFTSCTICTCAYSIYVLSTSCTIHTYVRTFVYTIHKLAYTISSFVL